MKNNICPRVFSESEGPGTTDCMHALKIVKHSLIYLIWVISSYTFKLVAWWLSPRLLVQVFSLRRLRSIISTMILLVASDKIFTNKRGATPQFGSVYSILLALQGIWGRFNANSPSSKSTEVSLYSSDVEACLVELPPKCTGGTAGRTVEVTRMVPGNNSRWWHRNDPRGGTEPDFRKQEMVEYCWILRSSGTPVGWQAWVTGMGLSRYMVTCDN